MSDLSGCCYSHDGHGVGGCLQWDTYSITPQTTASRLHLHHHLGNIPKCYFTQSGLLMFLKHKFSQKSTLSSKCLHKENSLDQNCPVDHVCGVSMKTTSTDDAGLSLLVLLSSFVLNLPSLPSRWYSLMDLKTFHSPATICAKAF